MTIQDDLFQLIFKDIGDSNSLFSGTLKEDLMNVIDSGIIPTTNFNRISIINNSTNKDRIEELLDDEAFIAALSKATTINDFFIRVEKKSTQKNPKPVDFDKLAAKSGLKEDELSQEERDYVANHLAGHAQKQQFNNASSKVYSSDELKPQESDNFPKFEQKFDKSKLLHRLSYDPRDWITIKASRANSIGVVDPVIKYIDNELAKSGITESALKLNHDVLDAFKNGGSPEDLINNFGTDNSDKLLDFSDKMARLKAHIEETYKTNEYRNGVKNEDESHKHDGPDDTGWTFDLTKKQKKALIAYIDDIQNTTSDMVQGVKGENGKEILDNLARIKNKELDFDDVQESITGLSKSHFLLADSKIRTTGKWLDDSCDASHHYIKQLARNINVGFHNHHKHTAPPLIFNSNIGENLEKPWQDFLEAYGERDENGELVKDMDTVVELKGSYVEALTTIIDGGFGNTAVESVHKLTHLLQSQLRNGDSSQPFPTRDKYNRAVSALGKIDDRKAFYLEEIGKIIDEGEVRKKGAPNNSFWGIYERLFEVNRYTQTRLEANRYFWDYWDEFKTGNTPDENMTQNIFGFLTNNAGTPARLQIAGATMYHLRRPLTFLTGASEHSVEKVSPFGFSKKNYYGGVKLQYRGPLDPNSPDGDKESRWQIPKRMVVRIASAGLLKDVKMTEGKWLFGSAAIPLPRLSKLGLVLIAVPVAINILPGMAGVAMAAGTASTLTAAFTAAAGAAEAADFLSEAKESFSYAQPLVEGTYNFLSHIPDAVSTIIDHKEEIVVGSALAATATGVVIAAAPTKAVVKGAFNSAQDTLSKAKGLVQSFEKSDDATPNNDSAVNNEHGAKPDNAHDVNNNDDDDADFGDLEPEAPA